MSYHRLERRRSRVAEYEDEPESEGSWAISYGDMVTLLLMFFILFFSTDKEEDRYRALETALLKSLAPKEASATGELNNFRIGKDNGEGVDLAVLNKWGGEARKVGNKVVIEFPEVSFFDFGEVKVNKAGVDQLRRFVQAYLPYSGNYLLTARAFTDNVPVLKNGNKLFTDNLDLSALRAVATLRVMQQAGIPLGRMRAEGYGELRLSQADREIATESAKQRKEKGLKEARKTILIVEPDKKDKL